jgi:hypothetical protein
MVNEWVRLEGLCGDAVAAKGLSQTPAPGPALAARVSADRSLRRRRARRQRALGGKWGCDPPAGPGVLVWGVWLMCCNICTKQPISRFAF